MDGLWGPTNIFGLEGGASSVTVSRADEEPIFSLETLKALAEHWLCSFVVYIYKGHEQYCYSFDKKKYATVGFSQKPLRNYQLRLTRNFVDYAAEHLAARDQELLVKVPSSVLEGSLKPDEVECGDCSRNYGRLAASALGRILAVIDPGSIPAQQQEKFKLGRGDETCHGNSKLMGTNITELTEFVNSLGNFAPEQKLKAVLKKYSDIATTIIDHFAWPMAFVYFFRLQRLPINDHDMLYELVGEHAYLKLELVQECYEIVCSQFEIVKKNPTLALPDPHGDSQSHNTNNSHMPIDYPGFHGSVADTGSPPDGIHSCSSSQWSPTLSDNEAVPSTISWVWSYNIASCDPGVGWDGSPQWPLFSDELLHPITDVSTDNCVTPRVGVDECYNGPLSPGDLAWLYTKK